MLPFSVPESFASQTDEQLATLLEQVRAVGAEYAQMDINDASAEDRDTMLELAKITKDIRAERASRGNATSLREEVAGAYAALELALGDEEPEADDAEETEEPAEPAAPPAPPAARPAPRKATAPVKVRTAAAPAPADVVPADQGDGAITGHLLASASNGGGETTWDEVGRSIERNLIAYSGSGGNRQDNVLKIKLNYPAELTASISTSPDAVSELLARVSNERSLPGGSLIKAVETASAARGLSLTAAGNIGWCAPSEILYQLCELETNDGMLDIPEINVQRGGIKYTTGPDFRSIFSGAGFFDYTEAQIIAGVTKPCMSAACPTFTDTRLDAVGVCIQADLLSLRGYPELISRFSRGAMVAHNHRVNAKVVNNLVTGSTAIATINTAGTVWGSDTSVLTQLLMAIDMAAEDMRYGNRMSLNATLEVVLPHWMLAMLRADVSRRAFYDGDNGRDQWALTQAAMNAWFTARNVRVQWIYDWQDAYYWTLYPTGAPGQHLRFGNDPTVALNVVNDYPSTVQFLIFPAGTWVRGNADIITLDTVYDSTLLAQNKATQLFTEQGILTAKTCVDSRVYTVTGLASGGLRPTGQTFAPVTFPPAP